LQKNTIFYRNRPNFIPEVMVFHLDPDFCPGLVHEAEGRGYRQLCEFREKLLFKNFSAEFKITALAWPRDDGAYELSIIH
jgi:hypothetical protein